MSFKLPDAEKFEVRQIYEKLLPEGALRDNTEDSILS